VSLCYLLVVLVGLVVSVYLIKTFSDSHEIKDAASKLPKMFNAGDSVVVAQVGSLMDSRLDAMKTHIDEGLSNILHQVQAGAEYNQNSDAVLNEIVGLLKSIDAAGAFDTRVAGIPYDSSGQEERNGNQEDARPQICFDEEECPGAACACGEANDEYESEGTYSAANIEFPMNPNGIFYIVAGPESSGNRYTVAILKAMGCAALSGHSQPWDVRGNKFSQLNTDKLVKEKPVCAAMHRSYPHGIDHQWVNLRSLIKQVAAANYEPRVVYITRNPLAVIQSQLKKKMVPNAKQAMANINRAKKEIYGYIFETGVWFTEFQYEQYEYKSYLKYVYKTLGYEGMDGIPVSHPLFKNGNIQYHLDK